MGIRGLDSNGPITDAMERQFKKSVTVEELNPQPPPPPLPPLCTPMKRALPSMILTATFITHRDERVIPINSGEVKIIGEVRPYGAQPVRSRLVVPEELGSAPLRIISACGAPHEIVLRRGEIVRFEAEIGANCELIRIAGFAVPISLFKAEVVYE